MPDDGPTPKTREVLGYLLMVSAVVGYYLAHDVSALGLQLVAGAAVLDLKLPRLPGFW